MIRQRRRWGFGAGLLAAGYLFALYRREKQQALQLLRAGGLVAQTAAGPVEYATQGQGPPILIMHGGGGGYDQGLWVGDLVACGGNQTIALSRPGYRRTPLATGRSLTAQAQAACALLDHLAIASAFVVGFSAGGLSALQFAIDHPERCRGLALLSAHGPSLATTPPARYWLWLLSLMLASDGLLWLMLKPGIGTLLIRLQGAPNATGNFGPLMRGVFPASDFRAGMLNDLENVLALPAMALETIRVPTLLLHGTGDASVPSAVAAATARRIANARLITIPGGSHFMLATHQQTVSAAVRQFIADCQAQRPGAPA